MCTEVIRKKNLFVSTAVHGKMFLVTKILKIYELSMLPKTKRMNVLSDIRRPLDYLEHQRPNMSTGKTSLRKIRIKFCASI